MLALADKGRKARVEKLLAAMDDGKVPSWWEDETRFLLRAALFAAGDRRMEKSLRDVDTTPVKSKRYNDWTYSSDGRTRGMKLTILAEQLGPSDPTSRRISAQ